MIGVDGEKPKVANLAAQLDVIAARHPAAAFGDQKRALLQMLQCFIEIDTFSGKERPLNLERTIDQGHQRLQIRPVRGTVAESIFGHRDDLSTSGSVSEIPACLPRSRPVLADLKDYVLVTGSV